MSCPGDKAASVTRVLTRTRSRVWCGGSFDIDSDAHSHALSARRAGFHEFDPAFDIGLGLSLR